MSSEHENKHPNRGRVINNGAIYSLGICRAAVYFIQHSTGFWMGVLGVLKAIVWPTMVVYQVLGLLKV